MNNVSFKAHFINSARIKRLHGLKYKDKTVSFVELNPYDMNDKNTIKSVSDLWKTSYSIIINNNFNKKYANEHFFAITTQQDLYEKIEPNSVLGLLQTKKNKEFNYIEFINAHPNYEHSLLLKQIFNRKKYKNIGKSMLNAFRNTFTDKPIKARPVDKNKMFFIKNGFRPDVSDSNLYVLT